jgi:hypothetical protein
VPQAALLALVALAAPQERMEPMAWPQPPAVTEAMEETDFQQSRQGHQAATAEPVAMVVRWVTEVLAALEVTARMAMRLLQAALAEVAALVARESMAESAALAAMAETAARPMVLRGLMPPIARLLKMAATGPMEPTEV